MQALSKPIRISYKHKQADSKNAIVHLFLKKEGRGKAFKP